MFSFWVSREWLFRHHGHLYRECCHHHRGRRLQRLAATSQVIAVTHLAQVAAFADHHFVIAKSSDGHLTTSGVRRLSDDERAAELARMMGGEARSEKGVQHAVELLERARRNV